MFGGYLAYIRRILVGKYVWQYIVFFKAILQISLYICSPNLNHLVNDHLRLDRTSHTAALNKEGKFNFTTCQENFPSSGSM